MSGGGGGKSGDGGGGPSPLQQMADAKYGPYNGPAGGGGAASNAAEQYSRTAGTEGEQGAKPSQYGPENPQPVTHDYFTTKALSSLVTGRVGSLIETGIDEQFYNKNIERVQQHRLKGLSMEESLLAAKKDLEDDYSLIGGGSGEGGGATGTDMESDKGTVGNYGGGVLL